MNSHAVKLCFSYLEAASIVAGSEQICKLALIVELKLTCAWYWWGRRGRGWDRQPWTSTYPWSHAVICYCFRTVERYSQLTLVTYFLVRVHSVVDGQVFLWMPIDLWYRCLFKEISDDDFFGHMGQQRRIKVLEFRTADILCLLFCAKI